MIRARSAPQGALACAAVALAFGSSALAQTGETLYVIEKLVVSVNSQADGSGERVGQIDSGDKVEVLERQDGESRVRIPSGAEGWVRSSYLSTAPPMRDQLKARTEELEKLRQEKSRLETELAGARKATNEALAAAKASLPAHVAPITATPAAAANEPTAEASSPAADGAVPEAAESAPPLFASGGIVPSRPSWIAALLVAIAALAVGFGLGWRMLDRRIRAKYGGLRIY
jgi:hypothetical protein